MPVLITGGSGLVGLHTARAFADAGHDVLCLDIEPKPPLADAILGGAAKRVRFLPGDIADYERLRGFAGEHAIEGIVHAGAVVNESVFRKDPLRGIRVNIQGTANVLEIARQAGKRVVYTSSGTVYGRRPDLKPIGEDEVGPQNFYAETKHASERLCAKYREFFGVDARVARISTVYGPGKNWSPDRYPIQQLCAAALAGQALRLDRGADYVRDYTYAADAALGIRQLYAAAKPPHDAYNVAVGEGYGLRDVADALNRLCPAARLEVGPGGFDGDFALEGSLRGPIAIDRARADLGFEPRYRLEAGLEAYLEFLRAHPEAMRK